MLSINFGNRSQVENSRLAAWAQPIVDINSNQIVGAELLARRIHTDGTTLLPELFLPNMLSAPDRLTFDAEMIRLAADFLANEGRDLPLDFVSVNVHSLHVASGALVPIVRQLLADSGADPHRLMIEATEHDDCPDIDSWRSNVERLKALGVRLAIDDFGIGYSNLTRLLDAPIDLVKIDMSLIQRSDDLRCRALLRGLVEFASEAQVGLVAEGVETNSHRSAAASLGITAAQGFLYGRPRPLAMLPNACRHNGGVVRPSVSGGIRVRSLAV